MCMLILNPMEPSLHFLFLVPCWCIGMDRYIPVSICCFTNQWLRDLGQRPCFVKPPCHSAAEIVGSLSVLSLHVEARVQA